MGKGGMSMPQQPDFYSPRDMGVHQEFYNERAHDKNLRFNNPNIKTPYGSSTWDRDAMGRPLKRVDSLNPESQQIFENSQGISKGLSNLGLSRLDQIGHSGFSLGGLPYDPSAHNPNQPATPGWQPMSYSRDWEDNYNMSGSSAAQGAATGQPYPGGGGQQGSTPAQPFDQARSGGLNPFYAEAKGANRMAQAEYDNQTSQAESLAKNVRSRIRNRKMNELGKFTGLRIADQKNFAERQAKNPNLKEVRRDSKGNVFYTRGGEKAFYNSKAFKKMKKELDWGKAPEFFDANFYSQQAGKQFDDPNNAWKHYVNKGKKQGLDFREEFQAPNELPEQYLPGPSSNLMVPYGSGPVQQQPAGGGAPQQAAPAPAQAPQGAAGGGGGMPAPPQQQLPPHMQAAAQGQGPNPNDPIGMDFPTTDVNTMPYDPRSYGNIDMYEDRIADTYMNEQMRNLAPQIEQQYDQQYQKLKDMGLPVGGEAWNKATANLNRGIGSQLQGAQNQATLAAGQEASRQQGMEQQLRGTAWNEAQQLYGMGQADSANKFNQQQQIRKQAIDERLLERNQNLNELAMMLGASPQMPSGPQASFTGAQYNPVTMDKYMQQDNSNQIQMYTAQMQAAMASQQAQSAAMGQAFSGLGSLATMGKG